MKILGKRVLIKKITKKDELEEKIKPAGIVLPEVKEERMAVEKGKVIDIGDEIKSLEKELKDKMVVYNAWAGDEIEIDEKKYIVVHIDDVLLVL